jgi:hypothetical protein
VSVFFLDTSALVKRYVAEVGVRRVNITALAGGALHPESDCPRGTASGQR